MHTFWFYWALLHNNPIDKFSHKEALSKWIHWSVSTIECDNQLSRTMPRQQNLASLLALYIAYETLFIDSKTSILCRMPQGLHRYQKDEKYKNDKSKIQQVGSTEAVFFSNLNLDLFCLLHQWYQHIKSFLVKNNFMIKVWDWDWFCFTWHQEWFIFFGGNVAKFTPIIPTMKKQKPSSKGLPPVFVHMPEKYLVDPSIRANSRII